jgi:hypothetical protein
MEQRSSTRGGGPAFQCKPLVKGETVLMWKLTNFLLFENPIPTTQKNVRLSLEICCEDLAI